MFAFVVSTSAMKKSFQIQTPLRMITVKIDARESGRTMWRNVRNWLAPSIVAASESSRGSAWKNPTSTSTPSGIPNVV